VLSVLKEIVPVVLFECNAVCYVCFIDDCGDIRKPRAAYSK